MVMFANTQALSLTDTLDFSSWHHFLAVMPAHGPCDWSIISSCLLTTLFPSSALAYMEEK